MDTALFQGDLVETKRVLYTPSDFARASLVHLQEIGELQAQKPHMSKRKNLASYLFFMVLSGSGILQYENFTHQISAGDCIFIDCQKAYSHCTSSSLWKLQWAHFYGPNLPNIYDKYIERGGRHVFRPDSLAEFQKVWSALYKTAVSSDYIRDMKINGSLNTLLTLIFEKSWFPDAQRIKGQKQNIMSIKKYLDDYFSTKITLDKLSARFFINKFYLTRIFKEQLGISVTQYLLQKRITCAKQLLRFTNKTVETIGQECGIGAVHYFSRMFKKIEGISPSEYRRRW